MRARLRLGFLCRISRPTLFHTEADRLALRLGTAMCSFRTSKTTRNSSSYLASSPASFFASLAWLSIIWRSFTKVRMIPVQHDFLSPDQIVRSGTGLALNFVSLCVKGRKHGLRILCGHGEECPRGAFRLSPALLPVLKGVNAHADHVRDGGIKRGIPRDAAFCAGTGKRAWSRKDRRLAGTLALQIDIAVMIVPFEDTPFIFLFLFAPLRLALLR